VWTGVSHCTPKEITIGPLCGKQFPTETTSKACVPVSWDSETEKFRVINILFK